MAHRQTPTVLVVDDTPDNLVLVSELLGGTTASRCPTAVLRALKAAQTDPVPTWCCSTSAMLEMDGYEVCKIVQGGHRRGTFGLPDGLRRP